jgi:transcriptional regulator with XRE-family HTH domain
MIRNERQYRVTMRQRKALVDQLDSLPEVPSIRGEVVDLNEPAFVLGLQRASLEGQIADLDAQLHEYEELQSGAVVRLVAESFSEIPELLVKARIAAGLTQRALAERIGLKEQQIQRYESELYASASLSRLEEVRQALDVEVEAGAQLPSSNSPLRDLRRRLFALGFDRGTVDRLLRDVGDRAGASKVMAAAERVARAIGASTKALLSDDMALPAFGTSARFKAPKNAAEAQVQAYARYAEGIAKIVSQATANLGEPRDTRGAHEFRIALDGVVQALSSGGSRNEARSSPTTVELFQATVRLLFDLGVPVVALRGTGAFHGACFAFDDRTVIVLKQTTDSVARWLQDLLHEVGHLRDPDLGDVRSWIDLGDIGQWSDVPEEIAANDFAADVLFEGRAGHVVAQCKKLAGGSVERLKAIVPAVARQAEVMPDVLANYLAFQLSADGINWWGTAASFQEPGTPWRTVVDELLTHLDFSALDQVERAILMDALSP